MIKRLRFDEVVMMSFIAVGAGALVVAGAVWQAQLDPRTKARLEAVRKSL